MLKSLSGFLLCVLIVLILITGCAGDPLADIFMSNIYPGNTDTYDVGSLSYRWDEGYFRIIHADNITGNITETDPVFVASDAFPITAAEIAAWNNAPTLYVPYNGATDNIDLNAKEVTNGILNNMVGKGTWTASGVWKLPAMFFNGDITTDRWTSLEGNTFFGTRVASAGNLSGDHNTFIGHHTGYAITSGDYNCAWGSHALFNITSGNGNVGVGYQTGNKITTGVYNVMIGGSSGPTTNATSNGLFIDTSETDTPLIGGNFTQDWVAIFDKLGIGAQNPSAELHIAAGTAAAGTAPVKLTTGTLLAVPEAGVFEYDGTGFYLTNYNHQRFVSQASDSIITSQVVANTTNETTVFTGVLNANELAVHRVYRVNLAGEISTASAADTIRVRVYINGATLVDLTSNAGVADADPCHGMVMFTVRSTGGAGTVSSHCDLVIGDASTHTNDSAIAVDTTAVNNITVTFQWSAAKADNIAILDQAFLEVLD